MVGKTTTQGDRAMGSDIARQQFHVDGSGITIGVISDSFNVKGGAATDILAGDLPGLDNPNGYSNPVKVLQDDYYGTDEGRAMLQIIHDIAPGAKLLFSAPSGGFFDAPSFIKSVKSLVKAKADIIVDDLGIASSLFEDGPLAQFLTKIVRQGTTYFSAMGNASNRSYESSFRPGKIITLNGVKYLTHDFDPGTGVDIHQDIYMPKGTEIKSLLVWDQPTGKVTTDLDCFLLNDKGDIVAQSTDNNLETGRAQEYFWKRVPRSNRKLYLVIGKKLNDLDTEPTGQKVSSSDSNQPLLIKWVDTIADDYVETQYLKGASTLDGHVNARGVIAVGASNYRTTPAFGGRKPKLEYFSSWGGTPILFDTQGNRLSKPEIRQKPEIVAPDNVSTTVADFDSFIGTSAAAPHAAAVAALMLQRSGGRSSLTPAQILVALQNTALRMDRRPNFTTGAGFIRADRAVLESYQTQKTGTTRNDVLQAGKRANNLYGLAGDDILKAGRGNDALFGALGQDILQGGKGNDYLLGYKGNDILVGGEGNDTLTGGEGNDRFICNAATGTDFLTDFDLSEKLVLSKHRFSTLIEGQPLSFASVKTLEEAQSSIAQITYLTSTGTIYYNPNGELSNFGTTVREGAFVQVAANLNLTAANFDVVA